MTAGLETAVFVLELCSWFIWFECRMSVTEEAGYCWIYLWGELLWNVSLGNVYNATILGLHFVGCFARRMHWMLASEWCLIYVIVLRCCVLEIANMLQVIQLCIRDALWACSLALFGSQQRSTAKCKSGYNFCCKQMKKISAVKWWSSSVTYYKTSAVMNIYLLFYQPFWSAHCVNLYLTTVLCIYVDVKFSQALTWTAPETSVSVLRSHWFLIDFPHCYVMFTTPLKQTKQKKHAWKASPFKNLLWKSQISDVFETCRSTVLIHFFVTSGLDNGFL